MARERSVKHSILRSFETLIRGMDPKAEQQEPQEHQEQQEQQKRQERQKRQEPVKPRTIVAAGEFVGRKCQVFFARLFGRPAADGPEAFSDPALFLSSLVVSP